MFSALGVKIGPGVVLLLTESRDGVVYSVSKKKKMRHGRIIVLEPPELLRRYG